MKMRYQKKTSHLLELLMSEQSSEMLWQRKCLRNNNLGIIALFETLYLYLYMCNFLILNFVFFEKHNRNGKKIHIFCVFNLSLLIYNFLVVMNFRIIFKFEILNVVKKSMHLGFLSS